jgi:hypothetical protein
MQFENTKTQFENLKLKSFKLNFAFSNFQIFKLIINIAVR